MKLEFHGAARDVTGSCHLVEVNGIRLLIDCGLYQGGRAMDEENSEPFGFEPGAIDYVLLTHAHLDHCGRLPLLVKRGFQGEIVTTSASRELARLVLLDSARLQEEEARYQTRRAARRGEHRQVLPLYDSVDALYTFDFFGRTVRYDRPLRIADGITATFIDAGHILGSASILLEVEEDGGGKRLLFSGDLGYRGRAIIRDPAIPPAVDYLVMETTYGDRRHKTLEPSLEELYQVIDETLARGGNVIIPTFALERAQELLYYLRQGVESGRLPKYMPLFLDSPMAISATEIFQHHPECFDEQTAALFEQGDDPFGLPGLRFTRETAESMALNQVAGGAVIMAGSGMCTGGRVRHHLKHNLWREECAVVFVGYAARGTLARRIIDGAETVRIFSDEVHVNAAIHTIGGFSAHADRSELLDWYRHTGSPQRTFLVHGEETAMRSFAGALTDTRVDMPELHQGYRL